MEARNEPRPLVGSIGNLAKVSGNFFLENVSKSHRYILKFKIHVSIFVNIYIYFFYVIYMYNLFDNLFDTRDVVRVLFRYIR